MVITILVQAALWLWFLGCITTYRIGTLLLVEGMGIRSAEFFMLCLFSCGLASYHLFSSLGRWILLAILLFWFLVQFFCHWYFTLFGVSEAKLTGYNHCFRNTIRLFPMSETRLIPDLYHIILHILIILNMILCLKKPTYA